jgi:hypothetical protein
MSQKTNNRNNTPELNYFSKSQYPPITDGKDIDQYLKVVLLAFYDNQLRNTEGMSLELAYEKTLQAEDDNRMLLEIYNNYLRCLDSHASYSADDEQVFVDLTRRSKTHNISHPPDTTRDSLFQRLTRKDE